MVAFGEAVFEVPVLDMIAHHLNVKKFYSQVHARHRLFNIVYKHVRNSNKTFGDVVAKEKASSEAKRACVEWRRQLYETDLK